MNHGSHIHGCSCRAADLPHVVRADKTSVYLDDEDKRRLGELARATGTSEADLIRRGVGLVLAQAERPRPRLGLGASTDGERARNADRLLSELGFGE